MQRRANINRPHSIPKCNAMTATGNPRRFASLPRLRVILANHHYVVFVAFVSELERRSHLNDGQNEEEDQQHTTSLSRGLQHLLYRI